MHVCRELVTSFPADLHNSFSPWHRSVAVGGADIPSMLICVDVCLPRRLLWPALHRLPPLWGALMPCSHHTRPHSISQSTQTVVLRRSCCKLIAGVYTPGTLSLRNRTLNLSAGVWVGHGGWLLDWVAPSLLSRLDAGESIRALPLEPTSVLATYCGRA